MINYLFYCILWTLAIWGLIDIVKNVKQYVKCKEIKLDNVIVVITAKNKEQDIEGILKTKVIESLSNNNVSFKKVYVTDLQSEDSTKSILEKISKDSEVIEFIEAEECRKLFEGH